MSRMVIVPDSLREAIDTAIDKALINAPAEAAVDREHYFNQLLAYFDENGVLPDFSIGKVQS